MLHLTSASITETQAQIKQWQKAGLKVGFVPTMGNLHKGHLSLVRQARQMCDKVIVSIFLNPIQFNDLNDYHRYPKTIARDSELLGSENVDILFIPSAADIYPLGFGTSRVVLDLPQKHVLCGASRKGHFDGVITVMTKLLTITHPDYLFMGEKDYQQSLLIQKLITEVFYDTIKFVMVPTCREDSKLACSSRNNLLSENNRAQAGKIYQCLLSAAQQLQQGDSFESIRTQLLDDHLANFTVHYFEYLNQTTLDKAGERNRLFLAASIEGVRLIDNLSI